MRATSLRLLTIAALVPTASAQWPSYRTAEEARADPALSALPGGVMWTMPGIGTDFVLGAGCQFVELGDGTARLTGRIRSLSRIYAAFLVDVQFSGRSEPPAKDCPPAGGPDLQLLPQAYAPAGPIDPGTFRYYTAASGLLTGVREFDGARVALTLQGNAQVGVGANNRNGLLGVAATFAVEVVQAPGTPFGPTSTATFCATLRADRSFAATHAMVDAARSPLPSDRALVLAGLPGSYVFVPPGTFVEYVDGHAEVHGTLARLDALDDRWQLDLMLGSRVDPAGDLVPPPGAPTLGLHAAQYAGAGGPIDPAAWHYYQSATGTLTGRATNEGGVIALAPGQPFQVGAGANQASLYFGLFGTCAAAVLQSPPDKPLLLAGDAELHAVVNTIPVLPLPALTPAPAPPSLPNVTDQGFVITGEHLTWIHAVSLGAALLTSTNPAHWHRGYFRVLDDQHLEVHPPQGCAPDQYTLRGFNPATTTNAVPVLLAAPAAITLCSEATLRAGTTQHFYVHRADIPGDVISAIAFSPDALPSVQPGFIALDIGNDFSSVDLLPPVATHDPVTGVGSFAVGPVPPAIVGLRLHFQAVLLELGVDVYPIRVSTVASTSYLP